MYLCSPQYLRRKLFFSGSLNGEQPIAKTVYLHQHIKCLRSLILPGVQPGN